MRPPVRLFSLALAAATLIVFVFALGWGSAERTRAAAAPRSKPEPTAQSVPGPPPEKPPTQSATQQKPPTQAAQPKPSGTSHKVEAGETLSSISKLYGVPTAQIRAANSLGSDQIRAGQALLIPGAQPLRRHRVESGDSLWELATRYQVSLTELLAVNPGVEDPGHLQIGQELKIPGGSAAVAASAPVVDPELSLGGLFVWPNSAPVSSDFGPRWGRNHNGIDLAANQGDPIYAARSGHVDLAGEVKGYGNTVILRHPDGTRTLYAHASKLLVTAGQDVKQGERIALVGSTGNSTGPHLHFEIIVNDKPRDPILYLPKK